MTKDNASLNIIENTKFRLMYIKNSRYEAKDWHSTPHTHDCSELFYVHQGKGSFLVQEETFDVKEDDLIIINPNVLHTEMSRDDSPLEYIVIGIDGLQFNTTDENGDYNEYSVHNFYDYKHEILLFMKTILAESKHMDIGFEEVCQHLLEVLIINIVRRSTTDLTIAPTQKITRECQLVEQYINQHFKEDITLDELAEIAFLNKYYLVHAFKKYTGLSPINFLIQKRIDEAKNLLTTTNYPVAEISSIIGFSSQSYFSQIFRKNTQMTPLQYRRTQSE